MHKSGDREQMEQTPPSKQAKRCVQSTLSWFVNPRVNGISIQSPPPSPLEVVKVTGKRVRNSEERKCQTIHKRNCRRKSLDQAFEEANILFNTGNQVHPFSSLHKETNRPTERIRYFTEMQSSCPEFDGDYSDSLPPIHVFETLNDNVVMPDWGNWKFLETKSVNLSSFSNLENFSSLFEGSVEHLKMESACIHENKMDLLLLSQEKRDQTVRATTSSKLLNDLTSKEEISSHLELVHVGSRFLLPPANISSVDKMNQNGLHKRRLASYHQRNKCFPNCCLWTDKYRPENALEVCGNAESVEFLSEWLKSWYENCTLKNTDCFTVEDSDCASYNNTHNMDVAYVGNTQKNVILITGPVGIGKSAAVFACAREQGFKVIEVNASSLRNGAYLRQTFGEAVDSLGLIPWLGKDQVHQTSKPMQELLSTLPNIANNGIQVDSSEMGSKICDQMNATGKKSASGHVANKTLLLFEEVDVVFNEDHGFISTILKLSEITKRPIILTSNKRKPLLPQLLNQLVVLEFKAPSLQELLCYISMVCTFEKVHVSCSLLEHIIDACLCDIRRILMLLQFWCQGMRDDVGHINQCSEISVPFDIDAVHLAIPELIPWDFWCELSEKLEEEISKTIAAVNENDLLMEVAKHHKLKSRESIYPWEINNSITAEHKKEEELHFHHSILDHKEFSHLTDNLEILFDDSCSPILSSQRSLHHKHSIVLSSPSNGYNLPVSPISLISQTHEFHGILPVAQIEKSFDSFEGASIPHVCDTFNIDDVSWVPQSSLISEDEKNSSGEVSSKQELPCFSCPNGSICICPELPITNSDNGTSEPNTFPENRVSRNAAFYLESIQGNEDLNDFSNEVKPQSSQSQLIDDECSFTGFNVGSAPNNRIVCFQEVASVPIAWRKFRSCHGNYKVFLSANIKYASLVTSITSKLADLISETDLIQQSCSSVVSESFHPDYSISCYDKQIDMGITFAQHGFCFFMMRCATYGSLLGCNSTTDFCQKILTSSTNSIALGKLLTQEICTGHKSFPMPLDVKAPQEFMLIGREPLAEAELYSIIPRVVPLRLSMVLKGLAFHEYLSFMMHISRLATSVPVEIWKQKHKRKSSLHHLSSWAGHFTSEQIELLARRCCYSSCSSL